MNICGLLLSSDVNRNRSSETAQKSKLHNLQYDEGGNHMAETETEAIRG